jgi:hypothetical protein
LIQGIRKVRGEEERLMSIKDGPGLDPGTHTLHHWLALSHSIAWLYQVQEGVSFTVALLSAALAIREFAL